VQFGFKVGSKQLWVLNSLVPNSFNHSLHPVDEISSRLGVLRVQLVAKPQRAPHAVSLALPKVTLAFITLSGWGDTFFSLSLHLLSLHALSTVVVAPNRSVRCCLLHLVAAYSIIGS
jgi:hypothetical protein